jgi:hypothetical protein
VLFLCLEDLMAILLMMEYNGTDKIFCVERCAGLCQ